MAITKEVLNVSKNKTTEFWVSHLIILAGTIIGVYLAASAGLKVAIQFELIKSDRDSYYMRSALLDELKDNTDTIHKWGTEYRGGKAMKFIGKPKDFKLDTYVWTTMQDNTGTFEIPSEILTSVRRYYRDVNIGLSKMTSREPAAKDVDLMLEQTKKMKVTTLILLKKDIEGLKQRLEALDVPL